MSTVTDTAPDTRRRLAAALGSLVVVGSYVLAALYESETTEALWRAGACVSLLYVFWALREDMGWAYYLMSAIAAVAALYFAGVAVIAWLA